MSDRGVRSTSTELLDSRPAITPSILMAALAVTVAEDRGTTNLGLPALMDLLAVLTPVRVVEVVTAALGATTVQQALLVQTVIGLMVWPEAPVVLPVSPYRTDPSST